MKISRFRTPSPRTFDDSGQHHRPRLGRSMRTVLVGGLMLCPEIFLLTSGITSGTSTLSRVILVELPAVIGLLCLLVGVVRLLSALRASARRGLDAIDLTPTGKGPLVRGGTLVPWESLTAVTVTLYRQLAPLSVVRTPQT